MARKQSPGPGADQVAVDPSERYSALLLKVIEDARCLRSLVDDLTAAARLTGRLQPPGLGGAVSIARGIDHAVSSWKMVVPDLMGVPKVDPVQERIREATVMLERQRSFLRWAEDLPNSHPGKSAAVAQYTEAVKVAEHGLMRARGQDVPADQVSLSERLESLIAARGSIRKARQELGLPVDPLPEVQPFPGSRS